MIEHNVLDRYEPAPMEDEQALVVARNGVQDYCLLVETPANLDTSGQLLPPLLFSLYHFLFMLWCAWSG